MAQPTADEPTADALTVEQLAGDPHPHWHRLRRTAPVVQVPALGGWVVLGHAAASAVLRDPVSYTVDDPRFSTGQLFGPSMLSTDGPEHARFNAAFAPGLRPGPVRDRFTETVRAEVDRLLRPHDDAGQLEVAGQLAAPLAVAVMRTQLELATDPDELRTWYAGIVGGVDRISAGQPAGHEAEQAHAQLAEALRRHQPPRPGLTSTETVANAGIMLFGGLETTEAMISLAVLHLLRQPDQADRARGNPELIAAAVEESLRLEPAATRVDRYTTQPVTLAGVPIPAGELVIVSLAAANRDPTVFEDPDSFDPTRENSTKQLAFAVGPHYCLGAHLARLETQQAVAALLDRRAALIPEETDEPRGLVFRKPARVTVSW